MNLNGPICAHTLQSS
uniref:Uncharacterized protein n=1 Tax=Anguilla anguilla TaxID=7936 RepID=A0A0E9T4J2_ANGAN